jgi:hypothetical protein
MGSKLRGRPGAGRGPASSGVLFIWLSAGWLLLSACQGGGPVAGVGESAQNADAHPPALPDGYDASCIVPSEDGLPEPGSGQDAYRYLLHFSAFGDYRTGTSGDSRMSTWLAGQLQAMGYQVSTERYPFERFVPQQAGLSLDGFAPKVQPLFYSGSTGGTALEAPLVDIGLGTASEAAKAKGAVAFAAVPMLLNSQTPTLDNLISTAAAHGARALVLALQGPANEIVMPNVDARTGLCGLPILLVGKEDGRRLQALSGNTARFLLDAQMQSAQFSNVVARLPGTGDDVLLIGTPKNPWFTSSAERGSSVGGLLSLARYFAAHGPYRPTLIFVATGGHEVGYLGLQAFLDAHPDVVEHIGAYVHLGASLAARDFVELAGQVYPTGTQNLITLYVSENPLLLPLAGTSMSEHGVLYDLIPPVVLDPGEQRSAYKAKLPIASISAPHFWFHTARDLPDLTDCALLDPVVRGYRQLIEDLIAQSASTLRSANVFASAVAGSPDTAAVCLVPAGAQGGVP